MGGDLVEENQGAEAAHPVTRRAWASPGRSARPSARRSRRWRRARPWGRGGPRGRRPGDRRSVRPAARSREPVLAQGRAVAVLGIDRRPDRHEVVDVALEPNAGPGEGARPRRGSTGSGCRGVPRSRGERAPPRRRVPPPRVRSRRAKGIVGPLLSRRLRERSAAHRADPGAVAGIRPPAPAGRGKRRRSPAGPRNNASSSGVSHDHPHLLGEGLGEGAWRRRCGTAGRRARRGCAADPRRFADAVVAVGAFEGQRHPRSRRLRPPAPSRKSPHGAGPVRGRTATGPPGCWSCRPLFPTSATKWRPTARSRSRGCGSRGRSDG